MQNKPRFCCKSLIYAAAATLPATPDFVHDEEFLVIKTRLSGLEIDVSPTRRLSFTLDRLCKLCIQVPEWVCKTLVLASSGCNKVCADVSTCVSVHMQHLIHIIDSLGGSRASPKLMELCWCLGVPRYCTHRCVAVRMYSSRIDVPLRSVGVALPPFC